MAGGIVCRPIQKWVVFGRGCFSRRFLQPMRCMTSGEVSTALRPFYFTVHPDLFGQFPSERAINESSLQVLSSYLQTLQQNRYPRPTTLTFYLRPQGATINKGGLKSVKIQLSEKDIRNTVVSILSTCNLPTTYVDNIAPQKNSSETKENHFRNRTYDFEAYEAHIIFQAKKQAEANKNAQTLIGWLKQNFKSAKEKLAACEPVREEVVRLQESLCSSLGLTKVLWDCGWNITHFRGCLQAFQALAGHHAEALRHLRGRILVFGTDTGVSLDGSILLNSGEVRHNWLDFLKKVPDEDAVQKTVPAFEKALSRVLREIRVVRRKFQPTTMANQYEVNLRRLTTSLSDYQGRQGYPKQWPESLSKFELVVETGAGPLMVSPTGQFIVPCSCPSFLLVNFISDNLHKADQLLHEYQSHKDLEKFLHADCIKEFGLVALDKDDSVTPGLMIRCCEDLLKEKEKLRPFLATMRLTVTNFYSVMTDGQICIPWNWKALELQ